MTHPTEMISAYLDGELSLEERSGFLEHLSSCGMCSAEVGEVQRVRSAVRSLPVVELPEGVLVGLDVGAEMIPLHRHRGVWIGAAAAVIALVIAVAALVTPPPDSVSVDELSSRFGARASLDPAFGPAKVIVPDIVEVRE